MFTARALLLNERAMFDAHMELFEVAQAQLGFQLLRLNGISKAISYLYKINHDD
jgi:hypothetical protein